MHFGESLQIFIKYVTTCDSNTITFKNNILSFYKEELVKTWNNIFNNNIQWTSISRSFVNYEIKSITPKDYKNNIKQYKFPCNFMIDTILIRPPHSKKIKTNKETKIIKKSILRNVQERKTFCIKKRVCFDDSLIKKNIIDKQILNIYDQIRQELNNIYTYNYDSDYKYPDKQLIEHSFSKIPF